MTISIPRRKAIISATSALAATMILGFVPGVASATPAIDQRGSVVQEQRKTEQEQRKSEHEQRKSEPTFQRTFLGTVTGSRFLEAPAYTDGTYVFEYVVTGVGFFDTYVNGVELGYVGGSSGTYQTKPVVLRAGGQLVQVVGPEGSATADLYIVRVG